MPGARAFWHVVMAAVVVVIAPFFKAIIIAMRQVVGVSSPGDVVLMLLVGDAGSSLSGLTARTVRLTARTSTRSRSRIDVVA